MTRTSTATFYKYEYVLSARQLISYITLLPS